MQLRALSLSICGVISMACGGAGDGAAGDPGQMGTRGEDGENGEDGASGAPGLRGGPGVACWDLDENGVCDLATEDVDGSGVCSALDCRGADSAAQIVEKLQTLEVAGQGTLGLNADSVDGLGRADIAILIDTAQAEMQDEVDRLDDELGSLAQTVNTNSINLGFVVNQVNSLLVSVTNNTQGVSDLTSFVQANSNRLDNLEALALLVRPHILGVSDQSSTCAFSFNGELGVRAAFEMCQATYAQTPSAHVCTLSEVQRALSSGSFSTPENFDNVTTHSLDSSDATREPLTCDGFRSDGPLVRGTRLTVELGNAPSYELLRGQNPQSELPVLCCR